MHFLRPSYDSFFLLNPILRISGPRVECSHTWLMILWTLVLSSSCIPDPIFCQGLGKWICKIIIRFNIIHSYDVTTQIGSHDTVLFSYRSGFTIVVTISNSTNCGSAITMN